MAPEEPQDIPDNPPGSHMIKWFGEIGSSDTPLVGGKAASLGEMYGQLVSRGVRIPNGFATTSTVYTEFLDGPVPQGCWDKLDCEEALLGIREQVLSAPTLRLALTALFQNSAVDDHLDLHLRTAFARSLVLCTPLSDEIRAALASGYQKLCDEYGSEVDCAVRSSATKEDSAMASFAGQYESYLNVRGVDGILEAWHKCAASAFT
ncbi:MAG: PEP/pyruvate-binding domain-containing protein, partial [Longimicrobiales bacterium]